MTVAPTDAGEGHRGQLARLARRGTASVLGGGFSAIFGVLLVVIVTNGFDRDLAGTLFAATSAFLILQSFALLGTDTGLVRWLPAQIASGRTSDLTRTLVVAGAPVIAFSLVVSVVVYVTEQALAPHLVGSDAAPEMTTMLRVLAIYLPWDTVIDMVIAYNR